MFRERKKRVETSLNIFWCNGQANESSSLSTAETGPEEVQAESYAEEIRFWPQVLDYKLFIFARRIQRCWRVYHSRQSRQQRVAAAITIQRWWRGFSVRLYTYRRIEELLQQRCIEHFGRSAIILQALFRGWWTRQTVHDLKSLHRLQYGAAEDLLNYLVVTLHHLVGTSSIPGIYSLRNSNCLAKVERLLFSMNFRFHNDRVRSLVAARKRETEQHRQVYQNSIYMTEAPYAGPDVPGHCMRYAETEGHQVKEVDRHMYKIIDIFEQAQPDNDAKKLKQQVTEKKRRRTLTMIKELQQRHRRDFYSDVIDRILKWNILDHTKRYNPNDIIRTSENMERFLHEISKLVNENNVVTCHCRMPITAEPFCH